MLPHSLPDRISRSMEDELFGENMRIGMTQGRLISSDGVIQKFPDERWAEEFEIAKRVGFDYIEWISDREINPNNPLWSGRDLEYARVAMQKAGMDGVSVTLDHLMARSWCSDNEAIINSSLEDAEQIIRNAALLNIRFAVLPFLESASLLGNNLRLMRATEAIRSINKRLNDIDIRFAVETDATVEEQQKIIVDCGGRVGLCYDTGNRRALGFEPADEIYHLADDIIHIHIKDKDAEGKNVLLGQGCVDFASVFSALKEIGYEGNLTFETSRGDEELAAAILNLNFVSRFVARP